MSKENFTFQSQVEASKSISRKTVSSTLQHNSTGLVGFHDLGHDGDKYLFVAFVINTITQREINCVIFAFPCADILQEGEVTVIQLKV